jgi:hypothetical protein
VNTKAKGRRRDRRSVAVLEAAGYRCIISAASLSEWDLIGIGTADVVLVQVKSNRGPGSAERDALQEYKVPPHVRKMIHVWRDHARFPIVEEL